MLFRLAELETYTLQASDGEIGAVDELYWSDDTWAVRYLVVRTGEWLSRRRVLISPVTLHQPDAPARTIWCDATRTQVEQAPLVDTEKPVSRQFEAAYLRHFGWPDSGVGGPMWGPFPSVGELARIQPQLDPLLSDASESSEASEEETSAPENPHLRSSREVKGYRFEGTDGELGHIEDFVIDDGDWSVKYLEIDTRNWWPGGKKVLLPRKYVQEVSWSGKKVRSEASRAAVKEAPKYVEAHPIYPEYEKLLLSHYERA